MVYCVEVLNPWCTCGPGAKEHDIQYLVLSLSLACASFWRAYFSSSLLLHKQIHCNDLLYASSSYHSDIRYQITKSCKIKYVFSKRVRQATSKPAIGGNSYLIIVE